ncbi:MAG: nucleoside recognition protein [Firmicutes bacterium]|nr:nucleoside recognition protein [Bacillota bacterium]
MLNYLWSGMIILGVFWAVINGRAEAAAQSFIEGGREAVSLAVSMAGIMAFWSGIMKIAEESGIIFGLTKMLKPINRKLFPSIPAEGKAMKWICTNFAANFLGLGWAATPAGIKAMKELQKLNPRKDTASNDMCMFLIINISSIQLISVNIIAYRSQYMSHNPWEVVFPTILATAVSTIAGVAAAMFFSRGGRK